MANRTRVTSVINGKTTFLTPRTIKRESEKHVERTILNEEFKELLNGKSIVMAYIRHRFKNYELKGYLKEIKETNNK